MSMFVEGFEVRIIRSSFREDIQCGDWELESHYFVDRADADRYFQDQRAICSSHVPIIQLRSCDLECDLAGGEVLRTTDYGEVIKEMTFTDTGIEVN